MSESGTGTGTGVEAGTGSGTGTTPFQSRNRNRNLNKSLRFHNTVYSLPSSLLTPFKCSDKNCKAKEHSDCTEKVSVLLLYVLSEAYARVWQDHEVGINQLLGSRDGYNQR
jgi:hypothetical protein